jgi:hypothetical protein
MRYPWDVTLVDVRCFKPCLVQNLISRSISHVSFIEWPNKCLRFGNCCRGTTVPLPAARAKLSGPPAVFLEAITDGDRDKEAVGWGVDHALHDISEPTGDWEGGPVIVRHDVDAPPARPRLAPGTGHHSSPMRSCRDHDRNASAFGAAYCTSRVMYPSSTTHTKNGP